MYPFVLTKRLVSDDSVDLRNEGKHNVYLLCRFFRENGRAAGHLVSLEFHPLFVE